MRSVSLLPSSLATEEVSMVGRCSASLSFFRIFASMIRGLIAIMLHKHSDYLNKRGQHTKNDDHSLDHPHSSQDKERDTHVESNKRDRMPKQGQYTENCGYSSLNDCR